MKIFVLIILGFIGLFIYVRFLEATTVFLPAKKILVYPLEVGLGFEDIHFMTDDHLRLHGWFIKASSQPKEKPTLIFFHGNAGNIGDRMDKILLFHKMGLNVFIIDYRGYGQSEGRPSERGMYLDAEAAYQYLKSHPDIDQNKFLVYGESLGGAAAVHLASEKKVAGLILDSTFTNAADMGKLIMPVIPSFLLSIKLDSLSKMKDIQIPKLFIHSIDDETVPYALGRKLYDAAPPPKGFVEISGDHNEGFFQSQQIYYEGIKNFLKEYQLL